MTEEREEAATFCVSDLDGTLLRNDATLSSFSRDVLREIIDGGTPFTVASARSAVSMRPILRGVHLRLPVIEINGAFVSDLQTGRHEAVAAMSAEVAERLLALIRNAGHAPFVTAYDDKVDRIYWTRILNEGMQWFLDDRRANDDPRLTRVDDVRRALDAQVVCITTIASVKELTALAETFAATCGDETEQHLFDSRYSAGWHWLTINDRHATKDRAIRTIRERYGLEGHELVVFGDELNDVGMFRLADRAIAVENAVDGLKTHATETIGPNEDDSVAAYLRAACSNGTKA